MIAKEKLRHSLGRLSRSDFVQRRKSKRLDFLRHSYGAVFYQAHPFRDPCRPQNPAFLDGVEYNQRPNSGNNNDKLAAWLENYPSLKQISGSDCHSIEQVGFGGIEIMQNVNNIKELTEIMKNTHVKLITTQD